jgi:uncharacterized protein
MVKRVLKEKLLQRFFNGKAIILLGARQTGKTTLVQSLIKERDEKVIQINCDEPAAQTVFEGISSEKWKQLIGNNKVVVIDEAQRIPDIGIKLKIAIDNINNVQFIVTGSSSLDLANRINEPLTGRKWEFKLFPFSWEELKGHFNYLERMQQFENRLIYGMYPEVVMNTGSEVEILNQLAGSYLYKDILSFGGIRKPELLQQLLRALALQVGNEVSYNELSGLLKVDKNTVMSYITLLEQAFIIFRLEPLSRNLRNEISTSRKIYFWDNGIRNSLISNFNSLSLRNDAGALWENFMICERFKFNHYHNRYVNAYFWRTHTSNEIDLVEESNGRFDVFEFKWSEKRKLRLPSAFVTNYPVGETVVINRENFENFV